jgi:hypothetical protein
MVDDPAVREVETRPPPSRAELQSFLQAMYKEQCDQARQHETMRQQATTIVLTVAGVVVSLAAASGGALAFMRGSGGLPNVYPGLFALYSLLGFFVIGIGRHGRKLSVKHYERNQMHTARARVYRQRLEILFPGYRFGDDLRKEAQSAHEKDWSKEARENAARVINERLYVLWIDLFRFLNGVGVFLIVVPLIVVAALLSSQLTALVLNSGAWITHGALQKF